MKIATVLFLTFVTFSGFGNSQSIKIGTLTWTAKNLDVTTFRNGDSIPQAKSDAEWVAAGENYQPAWCYYDNDPKNGTKYGKLYNWFAVNDARGLAPSGWHIPTDEEWTELSTFLGGEDVAGDKMKMQPVFRTNISYVDQGGYYAQNWISCSNCKVASPEYKKICPSCKGMGGKSVQGKYIPKTKKKVETKEEIGWNGNNSSGFSGLPGGFHSFDGDFSGVGNYGNWWSASEGNVTDAWDRVLLSYYSSLGRLYSNKGSGFSVRCVRD
jgi:uncharacterized protein (TIGR02145 family)